LIGTSKEWLGVVGDLAKFAGRDFGEVFGGKVFKYTGEVLRQCGVLVLGSALTIWTLMFILGLTCGIEGAYFNRSTGTIPYTGVFAAWCDLREVMPYGFGYMMSAKVGTGLVAEIGAMQIADEVDALEVMGISSMTFLVATRLIAGMLTLPFMYLAGIGVGFFASYIAVVHQIAEISAGPFFMVFWIFQNPPDVIYSVAKAFVMGIAIVIVATSTATRPAVARSEWARRPPSRWWSTWCSCT